MARVLVVTVRKLFSVLRALDRADLPFMRYIPARTKRRFTRFLYKPLTRFVRNPIQLNGLTIYIPHSADYSYLLHEHEPGTQKLLQKSLKPGNIAVDVGANIGYLTLLMARLVSPNGKVYAVEPGEDNLLCLRKNIELNSCTNVEVLPVAAGAKRSSRPLYIREAGTLHSFYPRTEGHALASQVSEMPLDELLAGIKIDLIKIDVEGAEIDVLAGMERILRNDPEIQCIIEWNPIALKRAGHTSNELPELLIQHGFQLWAIDEETAALMPIHSGHPFTWKHISQVNLYARRK
jgi:FkbM family methyltransferase